MIPLPNDITADDAHQWLNRGIFYARLNDTWELGLLVEIHPNREITVRLVKDALLHTVHNDDIRCHWPACGAINTPELALYVQRHQERQYRRTFVPGSVRLVYPDKWLLLKTVNPGILQRRVDEWSIIEPLFNPTYPSCMEEAKEMLREVPSVALTPQIMLVGDYREPKVYYRGERMGVITDNVLRSTGDPRVVRRVNKLIGGY